MTIPSERTRAVLATREFLEALANSELTLGISEEMRYAALALLRHYPDKEDMRIAALACPLWFGNPEI